MKHIALLLIFLAPFTATCLAQEKDDTTSEEGNTAQTDNTKSTHLRIPTGIGNYLVGGDLLLANAVFQKGYEANYTVGLSPRVGLFILPNIALGISGELIVQENKSYRNIHYGLSPFARVYFAHNNGSRPARPLQAFVEAGVGFGGDNSRYNISSGGTESVSTNGIRLSFSPGVDYFLNEHVATELGLSYLFIGGKPDAHIVALNLGFQVFLGR